MTVRRPKTMVDTREYFPQSPILFKDNPRAQEHFETIVTALNRDPQVFRRPLPDELAFALGRVAGSLHRDILRGQDFLEVEYPSSEALEWLLQPEHAHLMNLGWKRDQSKLGRLGSVVAMHSRREELAALVTTKFADFNRLLKVLPHVSRLLTHTNAPRCEEFAFELVRHPDAYQAIPSSHDGTEAFIFYTYGPYVLGGIKEQGAAFPEFMDRWVKRRKPSDQSPGNALYPGIEQMYEETGENRMHYLRKDGQDPSHAFVAYVTKKAILPVLS